MKEFFALLRRFDLKGIFLEPTQNGFLQFFRYAIVGGIATVVDWGALYLLTEFAHMHHLVSAIFSFILGLLTNFLLSKRFVCNGSKTRVNGLVEFAGYAAIGVIGLGITELILFLLTDLLGLHYMISKAIATVVVLFWNYLARKLAFYRS